MTETETETAIRRRAPGMSSEERRSMIVSTALPLVAEHGAAITTAQIARAAGIGEATIFRAFTDKDELLDACVAEALNPDHVLRELASISLDEPLPDRLAGAADALHAHLERMGAILGALHGSGHPRGDRSGDRPGGRPGGRPPGGGREASMQAVRDAVAELMEPERASLRLEPVTVAGIFLRLLFRPVAGAPAGADAELTTQQMIDVLLHGALRRA